MIKWVLDAPIRKISIIQIQICVNLCTKHKKEFKDIIADYSVIETNQYSCQAMSCKNVANYNVNLKPAYIRTD